MSEKEQKEIKELKEELNFLEKKYLDFKKNYLEHTFKDLTNEEDVSEILIDLYEKSRFNRHLQNAIEELLLEREDISGFNGQYFLINKE